MDLVKKECRWQEDEGGIPETIENFFQFLRDGDSIEVLEVETGDLIVNYSRKGPMEIAEVGEKSRYKVNNKLFLNRGVEFCYLKYNPLSSEPLSKFNKPYTGSGGGEIYDEEHKLVEVVDESVLREIIKDGKKQGLFDIVEPLGGYNL